MHSKLHGVPTVDVAILQKGYERVLLVGKNAEEGKFRFPGAFFNPENDETYEDTAQRLIQKEVPGARYRDLHILKSCKISDWRYQKTGNSIITLFMLATYDGGDATAGQGADQVRWVTLQNLEKHVVESHLPLVAILKNRR